MENESFYLTRDSVNFSDLELLHCENVIYSFKNTNIQITDEDSIYRIVVCVLIVFRLFLSNFIELHSMQLLVFGKLGDVSSLKKFNWIWQTYC